MQAGPRSSLSCSFFIPGPVFSVADRSYGGSFFVWWCGVGDIRPRAEGRRRGVCGAAVQD